MATENKCPHCGKPVPATALQGICPECMLKAGLSAETGEVGPGGSMVAKPPPQPVPRVDEIAPHFPQLEILECLGRGGMGVVYKARQPKLDRLVALKILTRNHDRAISDTEFTARFQQEARALARLNHPDIVAVYDFGEAGGYHYLLMEFVDGLTLRQLLQTRKLSPEQALSIVPKICEALQFAHERGIVHRDIKPENILLDKQGQVKIADFGIAKILGPQAPERSLTGAKDVIGTPHYMAPEQVEKPTQVDHRADIYSLGVVFYEMLTGELPLGNFQRPSRKVQVDVRLDEVVLHALEKEPDRRYQHASEVKTDVETIAATPGLRGERGEESPSPEPATRNPKSEMVQSRRTSAPTPPWVTAARWTARVFGTLLLAFYGFFILVEGLPPVASQPEGVQMNFAALGLMLLGFVIGWKRDGAAALFIASGWTLWQISEGHLRWNLFQTPLPVAVLYGFCWWATQGRRTRVAGTAVITLVAALGLGRLFVPANVFVRGVVVDAQTGQPVPNAELRLLPRSARALEKGDPPNTRTDPQGRFGLYVGWYAEGKEVAVSIPGYTTLTTNLGHRPLGARQLNRDFRLQSGRNTNHFVIEFDKAQLRDAIQGLAKHLGRNVVFDHQLEPDPGLADGKSVLQQTISLRWQDVPAERAFDLLLNNYGLEAIADAATGISRIAKKGPEGTAAAGVEVPPVVIETFPQSGAANVDPTLREIRATFSKPMQNGNWAWGKWGEENFPELTGESKFLEDQRTCVLPVRLQPGKVYALWLNSDYHQNFKDREGRSAVPYLLIFETRK